MSFKPCIRGANLALPGGRGCKELTRKLFITLDCAIQRPRVPGRARSAAARKNVNNKRETRKHFIQLWSLMPRSCSISLNGGIPMLRICFALIVYIHGYHFVTAFPRQRFAPMHADALRVRHLPHMSHRSSRLASLQPSRRHRASPLFPRAIGAPAICLAGARPANTPTRRRLLRGATTQPTCRARALCRASACSPMSSS